MPRPRRQRVKKRSPTVGTGMMSVADCETPAIITLQLSDMNPVVRLLLPADDAVGVWRRVSDRQQRRQRRTKVRRERRASLRGSRLHDVATPSVIARTWGWLPTTICRSTRCHTIKCFGVGEARVVGDSGRAIRAREASYCSAPGLRVLDAWQRRNFCSVERLSEGSSRHPQGAEPRRRVPNTAPTPLHNDLALTSRSA